MLHRVRALLTVAATLALGSACGARAAGPPATAASGPATAASPSPTSQPTSPAAPPVIRLEPMRIEVIRDAKGREQVVAYDARELFDAANEALLADRNEDALRGYDQLLAEFPDSVYAVPALFNAGLAHEARRENEAAIARYRELAGRRAPSRDVIDALVRMGAVMAELERWSDAAATFEQLLDREDLTAADRVEALARLGYVLLEAKDYIGAEEVLRSALGYHDELTRTGAAAELDTDYYVAMARYYLAQIPHRQFAAIPIRLPDKQIERDMEAKAELVLIAHDRYLKTVELGNPYWATAAGYQLASMQKEFWDALVITPVPEHLPPEAATFYTKEVHRLSRVFLDKALTTHRKNVELAEVRGISTVWVEASRRAASEVAAIIARESAGEIVVPTTGPAAAAPAPGPGNRADGSDDGILPYIPGRVDL
jgi:tetratricopeptide (TPR) repeat protein